MATNRTFYLISFGFIYFLFSSVLLIAYTPAKLELGKEGYNAYFGSKDYIEYWAAARVLSNKLNIYDPAEMLKEQSLLVVPPNESDIGAKAKPLMMWNPPWLLVLMSPILFLSLSSSVIGWLIASILFTIVATRLLQIGLGAKNYSLLYLVPGVFLFHPIYFSLKYGQMGCLLLLGCAFIFHGLRKKCLASQVAGLSLISVKPHLFFLVIVLIALQSLKSKDENIGAKPKSFLLLLIKKYQAFFFTLIVIALLCVPIEIRSPGTTLEWLANFLHLSQNKGPDQWASAALFSALPVEIDQFLNIYLLPKPFDLYKLLEILRFGVPFILACSVVIVATRKRFPFSHYLCRSQLLNQVALQNDPDGYFLALIASITFAPFAWHFDSAPLALAQGFAFYRIFNNKTLGKTRKYIFTALYLSLFLFTALIANSISSHHMSHHKFFLFPSMFFVLFIYTTRK